MASSFFNGRQIEEIELLDLFPASEGMIAQYYGRIGSGKTYAATHDILDLLKKGKVIYANWRIHYEGTDERSSLLWIIGSLLMPWRKRFFNFPAENLKYFEFSDKWARTQLKTDGTPYNDFTEWLSTRTDCYIFGDEGHVMFDSYQGTRMSIDKRTAILHTRHFNRTIFIISQRPTAIHVAMRANVNVFYRCEQLWSFMGLVRFRRTEFQDMMNESVDEDEEKVIGIKQYWGKKRVFDAYDTKYLRGDMPDSQKVMFTAYDYGFVARLILLLREVSYRFHIKKRPSNEVINSESGQEVENVIDSGYEAESIQLPAIQQVGAEDEGERSKPVRAVGVQALGVLGKEGHEEEARPVQVKTHVPILLAHIKKKRQARKETRSLRVQGRSIGRRVKIKVQTSNAKG